jgi:uncharacterized protein (TIGR02118 family)
MDRTGLTVVQFSTGINQMIKRTSLVWKRPELTDAEFRRIWLGDHVVYAKQLPGVREYTIDFIPDAPAEMPSAIATLRFDSREALDAAFSIPRLKEGLMRTRDQFAKAVQVVIVDECVVVARNEGDRK